MEKIDQILLKIYTILDRAVEFFKHITRLEIMTKINEMSRKIHSSLILLAILLTAILAIYLSIKFGSGEPIIYGISYILGALVLSYLAKDFHGACESQISANRTTLSNNAILRFSAISSLLAAILLFLGFLASFFSGDISQSLLLLFYALILYLIAGTMFNPSLININVSSDSSSGEDFITIFSSGLKTFLYFERIISSLLILLGIIVVIQIIIYGLSSVTLNSLGLIPAGIAFPILAYLSFTILWFVNSLLLSILSLRKNP
tara:strand:- start:615 stop:1400 length:786 start_codon:yes stop_codon:yes gene_type:complete